MNHHRMPAITDVFQSSPAPTADLVVLCGAWLVVLSVPCFWRLLSLIAGTLCCLLVALYRRCSPTSSPFTDLVYCR